MRVKPVDWLRRLGIEADEVPHEVRAELEERCRTFAEDLRLYALVRARLAGTSSR
jgi:hypothetical protein